MISFVYSARKEGLAIDVFKTQLSEYAKRLDMVDGTELMQFISNSVANCEDYTDVLSIFRQTFDSTMRSAELIMSGLSYITYFDTCSKKISNAAHKINFTSDRSAMVYLAYYVWWVYSSVEQMLDCLINNGGVSEIELVGPKTKDYIKDLNLVDVPKRFGTPNDYTAEPLIFKYPHFNLFGPPMTTGTYAKSTISRVYEILDVADVTYQKCGKTTLARPAVPVTSMGLINVWGEIAGKFAERTDPKTLKRDFFYDVFIYKMCSMLSGVVFNCDTVGADFEALRTGGTVPKYLENIKLNSINSIPFLMGLIY